MRNRGVLASDLHQDEAIEDARVDDTADELREAARDSEDELNR
jgi:hypothetical protein